MKKIKKISKTSKKNSSRRLLFMLVSLLLLGLIVLSLSLMKLNQNSKAAKSNKKVAKVVKPKVVTKKDTVKKTTKATVVKKTAKAAGTKCSENLKGFYDKKTGFEWCRDSISSLDFKCLEGPMGSAINCESGYNQANARAVDTGVSQVCCRKNTSSSQSTGSGGGGSAVTSNTVNNTSNNTSCGAGQVIGMSVLLNKTKQTLSGCNNFVSPDRRDTCLDGYGYYVVIKDWQSPDIAKGDNVKLNEIKAGLKRGFPNGFNPIYTVDIIAEIDKVIAQCHSR